MRASASILMVVMATSGLAASIQIRQNQWGPNTCPTKAQCEASCKAVGLVYAAHSCNNAWTNCACNYA
ncbi:hypothetical protein C7974DRAFT_401441 [Boeremia exigua]|uniref:uncharacterized protein n=1 Tax=Boeremia exigua TaxID=749465 RepID=UPI001E8E825F|nr:uncharacterized protein C7974DRAFT_401441 [Boeremia exigua]KAH6619066.1 hypothetical protein C7974DRAFT_401441 [Boeremia exigua]